jgi:hypothetical protein
MQYRGLRSPYAEERLERLLQESSDPFASAIALAAREIDALLLSSPITFGESRYDNLRIGFVGPLGVDFEVMDDLLTIVVHDVWWIRQRN